MEEPYVVASLPQPLDSRHGHIFAAPVYSLSTSRKRKRHEVVVSIDGESVNIYNIQTQHAVGSYALPPQTYLAANPCSAFCKGGQSSRSHRQTVLAVSENSKRRAPRLVSFTEESRKSSPTVQSYSAAVKRERLLRDGRVLGLDIIPVRSNDSLSGLNTSTIVSYANGDIDCISTDDLEMGWEYTAAEREAQNSQVHYSTTIDVETASKGFLRNREDVLEDLRSHTADTNDGETQWLLFQVLTVQGLTQIRVSSIRAQTQSSKRASFPGIRELFACQMPPSSLPEGRFELHAGSGLLYQMNRGQVKTFDVCDISPTLTFDSTQRKTFTADSFIRLTNSSVLIVSHRQATVYENKYGSVVSSSPMPAWLSADQKEEQGVGQDRKPKRKYLECVSSLSDLGLVVMLAGNSLVALQVGQATRVAKRARSQGPLLVDLIGQKRRATECDVSQPNSDMQKSLDQWKRDVNRLVQAKDVEGLEHLLAQDVDWTSTKKGHSDGEGSQNEPNNGQLPSRDIQGGKGGQTKNLKFVRSTKAMYILGQVFRRQPQGDHSTQDGVQVEGAIKSWEIIRSLALRGLLTSNYIQLALSKSNYPSSQLSPVAPGAIMEALGQLDPDLSFVQKALALPIHWDVSEIIQGVRLLMRVIAPHAEQTAALSNIADSDGDIVPIDGEELAASRNSELQACLAALRPVFARLQTFPQDDVTKGMRSIMNYDEILFLVGVLRLMLADAGWTSRYVDGAPNTSPDDLPIFNIAKMLNSAVDAIGTVGWIVGGSSTSEVTENLVACLRAEISAALEGCYEAVTLSTLLLELRRCEGSKLEKNKYNGKTGIKPDAIPGSTILPLGSSIELPVVEDRSLWEGKAKQRPQTAAGNRFIGKYSFERIRL